MAYKKRTYKRRATKKGKGANDKTVTVWSDHSIMEKANKALNVAMQIKRFINVEVKRHDLNSTIIVDNSGIITNLTSIPQGDTGVQRDGISVKPMNLTIRYVVQGNVSATTPPTIRMILFRGKQENSVAFLPTDILETASIISPKNYSDRYRTKVIFDKRYTMNDTNDTAIAPQRFYTFSQKIFGHINFEEGSNAVENGGIYLLLLSNQSVNTPAVTIYSRLTFTDN